MAVTVALQILVCDGIAAAGEALRGLVMATRSNGRAVDAPSIGWGRSMTPALTASHLSARAPLLVPSEQLRSHHCLAGHPTGPPRPSNWGRKLPAALWPESTLRLTIPGLDYQYLSAMLPRAILVVNSRLSVTRVCLAMGPDVNAHFLSHFLRRLENSSRWPHSRLAIIRLADYLHAHDCRINCQRRRALDYSSLLTPQTWRQICGDLDIRTGGDKRSQLARCHLYTVISGNPATQHPGSSTPTPS